MVTSKEIYQKIMSPKAKPPTSIETWVNLFPFLEIMDWTIVYKLPFKTVSEPYLQSFQYKVINRILNCNERLKKWNIKDSEKCDYCDNVDTIEHHLHTCEESQKIWCHLQKWLLDNLGTSLPFTVCEVMFGLTTMSSVEFNIINFLILLTKWYINRTKSQNQKLYFIDLLSVIREKIKIVT